MTSALVPALRPSMSTAGILIGQPVSSNDWSAMAGLANYLNGHGGMLIPWCAVGHKVDSGGTATLHFYVGPKLQAVERIWCLNLRSSAAGTTASITCGGASAVTVTPPTIRDAYRGSFVITEQLSAKTSTAGDVTVSVEATGGDVTIASLAMYEQTRSTLDATDYGVDLGTTRVRTPILDAANASVAGVCDAYKNLDARRAGIFHWSAPTGDAVHVTSADAVSLFALSPPALAAIVGPDDTISGVTVAAYAKVNSGSATVTFDSSGGSPVGLNIDSTSFAWVTKTLSIDCEDLSVADGRRSSRWEAIVPTANVDSATSLDIAAISVIRDTKPI